MDISLRFESGNKKIEVGKGKAYRLLRVEGLESSQNEIYTTVNAYGDGLNVDNKKIKAKPLLVEAEYQGQDKEGERRKLISFFNLHKKGNVVAKVGGIEKSIEYVVENFNSRLINVNNPLSFLVSLLCPDPFFKDLFEKSEEIAVWRGSFSFPLELVEEGVEVGFREPSLIVNVYNNGDISCGMRIQFKALATVTNPSLFNVNTREEIKINKTMEAGDVITVTTHFQNKRVTLTRAGVNTNAFNYLDLDSEFLQLAKGDNLFRYDADENLENLEVNIYYTPLYLGV